MTGIKQLFTNMMVNLKKHNQYSTWKNLTLGLTVVLLVVVLSIMYFNRLSRSLEIQPLSDEQVASTIQNKEPKTPIKSKEEDTEKKVIVQEGEGLWHVALRVCGTGEAYSVLAEANNLTIESEVFVGQQLILKCK